MTTEIVRMSDVSPIDCNKGLWRCSFPEVDFKGFKVRLLPKGSIIYRSKIGGFYFSNSSVANEYAIEQNHGDICFSYITERNLRLIEIINPENVTKLIEEYDFNEALSIFTGLGKSYLKKTCENKKCRYHNKSDKLPLICSNVQQDEIFVSDYVKKSVCSKLKGIDGWIIDGIHCRSSDTCTGFNIFDKKQSRPFEIPEKGRSDCVLFHEEIMICNEDDVKIVDHLNGDICRKLYNSYNRAWTYGECGKIKEITE